MSDSLFYSIPAVSHPTDFSHASDVAFFHALKIALCNRSSFDMLHVDAKKTDSTAWKEFPRVRETLERWGLLDKGAPKQAISQQLGVDVQKIEMISKTPIAAISKFLERHSTNLIVLATQGREGPPRWLKPSFSERLARRSRTATLFVPDQARGFVDRATGDIDLSNVLLPLDHTPNPQVAIDATTAFLQSLNAQAGLIEAFYVGSTGQMPKITLPREPFEGHFQYSSRPGQPVEEIINLAQEGQANLIVMATEGHHGFLDALNGSTTEQVIRRAPCPVLAIPAQAD